MSHATVVAAVDIGAESGRVMAARFDGHAVALDELHRFANQPREVDGLLAWDVEALWAGIRTGLTQAVERHGADLRAIGVDTWAVDFVLVDRHGAPVAPAGCYRDPRTQGVPQSLDARIAPAAWWRRTGIRALPFNTAYQLVAVRRRHPEWLTRAHRLLTMPDYLHFRLCGVMTNEWTNASSTQLLKAGGAGWDHDLIARLGLSPRLFAMPVRSGTVLGAVHADLGAPGVQVVAPACHDTGSAVAAIPGDPAGAAFISCGTWSLMGAVVDHPVLDEAARRADLSNELAWDGRTRLLKNIAGLWVMQQCRAALAAGGQALSYPELERLAETAGPRPALDVDDPRFFAPHSAKDPYLDRVAAWHRERGLVVPADPGALSRCVHEGLARAYAACLSGLERSIGQRLDRIHLMGGGSRDALLCRLTADACRRPVFAGPAEATALGNALVQFVGLGAFAAADLPAVAAASAAPVRYDPAN